MDDYHYAGNLSYDYYSILSYLDMLDNVSLYGLGPMTLGSSDFVPIAFSSPLKVTLAVLYILMACGAVLGNVCVLLVILCNPALRTVTNTFIVSLAVSDALIAAWNIPLQLLYYLNNEWSLGEPMCKITSFVQGVSILASILTLAAISIERYYVICNPIKARYIRSTKSAVITVVSLWLVATIIAMPLLWIQTLSERLALQHDLKSPIKIAYLCVESFPNIAYKASYSYGFVIVFYVLPVFVMTYAYGKMAKVLWMRTNIDEAIASMHVSDRRESQKRSIIRMLFVLVVCFSVCWLPFFSVHIALLHSSLTYTLRVVQAFALLSGYFNSFLNPFIYFFLNAKFSRAMKKAVPRVLFLRKRSAKYARKPTTQVTIA